MFLEKCVKHFEYSCRNIIIWTCIPWKYHHFWRMRRRNKIIYWMFLWHTTKGFWWRVGVPPKLYVVDIDSNCDLLIRYKWLISYFDGNMDFSYILIYESSCSYIPCGRFSTQSNFDVTSYRIYKKNVAFWNHNNLRRVQFLNSIHVRNNTPYCIQRNW